MQVPIFHPYLYYAVFEKSKVTKIKNNSKAFIYFCLLIIFLCEILTQIIIGLIGKGLLFPKKCWFVSEFALLGSSNNVIVLV